MLIFTKFLKEKHEAFFWFINNLILQRSYSFYVFAGKKALTMKRTEIKLTEKEVIFPRKYRKPDNRSEREYNRANIPLLLDKGKKDSFYSHLTASQSLKQKVIS